MTKLATDLPPPKILSDVDIAKIKIESRRDREYMDKLVEKMQTITADDLKIRIK